MTTGLRKTINIIMFKSIKESAENWLQPRGSRAGTHPTPAPTHPLPPEKSQRGFSFFLLQRKYDISVPPDFPDRRIIIST